jgi:hypothetical protein
MRAPPQHVSRLKRQLRLTWCPRSPADIGACLPSTSGSLCSCRRGARPAACLAAVIKGVRRHNSLEGRNRGAATHRSNAAKPAARHMLQDRLLDPEACQHTAPLRQMYDGSDVNSLQCCSCRHLHQACLAPNVGPQAECASCQVRSNCMTRSSSERMKRLAAHLMPLKHATMMSWACQQQHGCLLEL